ncbi:tetratricopeptide repeat protein [Hymenobacter terrigena]
MKQVAWISMIPQLVIMFLIGLVCYLCGMANPVFPTAVIYFGLALILRNFVARDHRKGMQLVKKQEFAEAIPFFEASYKFFTENSWVDEYRYITLLSSSRMCYREMALCNVAFCYTQIGEGRKAAELYKQVLETYPENGLAQVGLKVLESAHN